MDPKIPKGRKPEEMIRERIIKMLTLKGWFCKIIHGNAFQSGLPDIYATHTRYGHRWIEVKDPKRKGDVFTAAQHDTFPKLCANGDGVWVLIDDTEDEYLKLMKRYNWYQYLNIMQVGRGHNG